MKFLIAVVVIGLFILLGYSQLATELPTFFYQTLALLIVGTTVIYFYLLDAHHEKPTFFVQIYMATLFAKIIGYGGYMLFVVWDDKSGAAENVQFFMIGYFVFTAIEIIFLYQKVRG